MNQPCFRNAVLPATLLLLAVLGGCSGGESGPPVTIDPNNPPTLQEAGNAAAGGDLAMVKACVDVDPGYLTAADESGQTLLHYAAAGGHADVIKYLLSNGADPNAVDAEGRNALTIALSEGGSGEVLGMLKDASN